MSIGGVAHLLSTADYTHKFTLIEIYGGAHLVFPPARATIETTAIYGDFTGYIHVPPNNKLNMTGVSPYKRVNMTWAPYVYQNATFVLPFATVEFRKTASKSYPALTIPSLYRIWGILDGQNAHLLVGHGGTLSMELSSKRKLRYVYQKMPCSSRLSICCKQEGVFFGVFLLNPLWPTLMSC